MNAPKSATIRTPRNPWRTFGIIVITMAVTLAIVYWVIQVYLFPHAFTPVRLTQQEQQRLDRKLERLGIHSAGEPAVTPEPYREDKASRDVSFSEKELNALLAHNTDLANKAAIDLSDNLASIKLLIPLDPDMPVVGGKTLKVTAGIELRIQDGEPRAFLKGVSVWGVPLPNAWLGNMKHVNLIEDYGEAGGFWQAIKDGVEVLEIKDGKLHIRFKK